MKLLLQIAEAMTELQAAQVVVEWMADNIEHDLNVDFTNAFGYVNNAESKTEVCLFFTSAHKDSSETMKIVNSLKVLFEIDTFFSTIPESGRGITFRGNGKALLDRGISLDVELRTEYIPEAMKMVSSNFTYQGYKLVPIESAE